MEWSPAKIIHFGGKHGTRNLPICFHDVHGQIFNSSSTGISSPPRRHKKKLEKIEVGYVGREENESWPQAGPLYCSRGGLSV